MHREWRPDGRRPTRQRPVHPHPPTLLDTPCREWWGQHDAHGYGRLSADGRAWSVHRWVWMLAHGPIPPGVVIAHHCDNPPCFRLDHLYAADQAQNMKDRASRRRYPGAPTSEQTEKMRRLRAEGWSQQRIADHLGFHQTTVSRHLSKGMGA